jgi:hypothetical protein
MTNRSPRAPLSQAESKDAEAAAHALNQRLEIMTASNEGEIESVFAAIKRRRMGGLIIAADVFFYSQMQRLPRSQPNTQCPRSDRYASLPSKAASRPDRRASARSGGDCCPVA